MRKGQSREKLAALVESFPAIAVIRAINRWKNGQRWRLPITNVHVQRADTETMHLQARNHGYFDRSYLASQGDQERGTQEQYLVVL